MSCSCRGLEGELLEEALLGKIYDIYLNDYIVEFLV